MLCIQGIRPKADAANGPLFVLLVPSLRNPVVRKPPIKFTEPYLKVRFRLTCSTVREIVRPSAVQPLQVYWVNTVLLALEPVARYLREDNLFVPTISKNVVVGY